jgi:hypothetical protein
MGKGKGASKAGDVDKLSAIGEAAKAGKKYKEPKSSLQVFGNVLQGGIDGSMQPATASMSMPAFMGAAPAPVSPIRRSDIFHPTLGETPLDGQMHPRHPMFADIPFGGYRADGGRVKPKKSYLVGENGPEMIMVDEPGKVIPIKPTPTFPNQMPMQVPKPVMPVQPPTAEQPVSMADETVRPVMPQMMQTGQDDAIMPKMPISTPADVSMDITPRPLSPMPISPERIREVQAMESPLVYKPGYDPRKTKKDNIRDEIQDLATSQPHKHRGFLNSLKGIGLGFLQGMAQSDPRLPFMNRIAGGLAGAAVGGVANTVDPNAYARMRNQQKMQQLYGQYQQLGAMDEQDAKVAKTRQDVVDARAEQERKDTQLALDILKGQIAHTESLYKIKIAPYLDYVKEKKVITQQDSDNIANMGGPVLPPAIWQKFVEADVDGQSFIRSEESPNYIPNTTKPRNPATARIPFQITPNDKPLPLLPSEIVRYKGQEQAADASDARAGLTRQDRLDESQQKQTRDRVSLQGDIAGAKAAIADAEQKIKEYRAKPDGELFSVSQVEAFQKIVTDNRAKLAKAQAELKALGNDAPKPKNPKGQKFVKESEWRGLLH